ncbi:chemotaxis protein CheW [Lacipirellula parvula]|uniref:Chemotaxis protein CheW n=1 Tax=Lacipirellula parvula TaxID=2650471 RepID=A0A5K7X8J3_9BACT|nr:chemotaxis protein CheW [Lacipirellula parvula]BBO32167.1 cheW [Lacipirellula parvula]
MRQELDSGGGDKASENGQFLTFTLQNEEYGIEILRVQEIKGFSKITPIPNAPSFVRGVMNLRGTVVPIIDLRARFAMTEKEYDQFTCIIVVNVGNRVVGLVVDTVSDVLNIPNDSIADPPELATSGDSSCITGMGKLGERIVMLLDTGRLVGVEALIEAETTAA